MHELALTSSDAGRRIDVALGQRVSIGLAEQPSTGYRWAVDRVDSRVLALETAEFVTPSPAAVGGPGERSFRFKVVGKGETDLVLKKWREWEGEPSVIERFSLTVRASA